MSLSNSLVHHRVYGKGRISSCEGNIVSVQFEDCTKKFIYPDAFKTHLSLEGKEDQAYIDGLFRKEEQLRKKETENQRQLAEKSRFLNTLPQSANAQAAFGFVQNDPADVEADWKISVGYYLSGESKNMPKTPVRIMPNSACLLTRLPSGCAESERCIFGVFMPEDDFIGADCRDGFIPAHPKFRLLLNDEQAQKLNFWHYFSMKPAGKSWGRTEMRYFSNTSMAEILNDMLILSETPEEKAFREEFLDYFCALNKIEKERLPGYVRPGTEAEG